VSVQLKIPRFSLAAILPMMSMPALFDAAIRLLGLVLVMAAVLLTSRWLTELTAPRLVAKLPSTQVAPPGSGLKMVSRLFGTSEARSQSLDGLQLAGVFATTGGGGFATFRTRSGAVSVFVGGDIAPGVKLKQIERDRVIIFSAGTPRELRLREGGGQSSLPMEQASGISPQQATASIPQTVVTRQQASRNRRADRPQEEE
jgi:hypothetical protein